ncbi:hypothetical protein NQ317_011894 [Molorchus minor]|uniref:MADF domain-containing protein n=1 Tax=Molorchus minor TaxID=1323400 RepID=A0ABQ9JUL9_9CUCU|nr:hypothetical protein NQ317_011894 [Molorchus minor]
MSGEWCRQNIRDFIDIYRSCPCLWKVKSPDYKDKYLKDAAYLELINFCKVNVNRDANKDFVFKKIQNMRSAFRKESKKVAASKKSGAVGVEVYQPALWYYKNLIFTTEQEESTHDLANINDEESISANDIKYEDDDSNSIDELDVEGEDFGEEQTYELDSTENSVSQTTNKQAKRPSEYLTPSNKKVSTAERDLKFMELCQHALGKTNVEPTEHELVGITIGKKLKRMDPIQAIYAEQLINKILTKGLLRTLTENTDIHENVPSVCTTTTPVPLDSATRHII